MYVLLGMLYSQLGISSSWATLFLPLVAFSILVLVYGNRKRLLHAPCRCGLSEWGKSSYLPALRSETVVFFGYLVVGVVVCTILFVWFLGSPDNYAQEYDNISHLGSIQSFVRSGIWSPFASSLYSSLEDAAINPAVFIRPHGIPLLLWPQPLRGFLRRLRKT